MKPRTFTLLLAALFAAVFIATLAFGFRKREIVAEYWLNGEPGRWEVCQERLWLVCFESQILPKAQEVLRRAHNRNDLYVRAVYAKAGEVQHGTLFVVKEAQAK